ncbi:MAG TPA: serine/threonine-protein kinase [Kofleriaceae bacterium]|nr:serine/threonine-protein kinase [Kofleriaceae bacterium]
MGATVVKDRDPRRADPALCEASTQPELGGESASASAQASPPRRDQSIDRYALMEEIGAGGMGVVYKAYDPDLRRVVALKVLRAGAAVERHAQRLEREARAIARLSHPNVVAIYDVGKAGDELFIAMEYIEGQSLRRWLMAGPHPLGAVLEVFRQAARGLAAAHDAGLVHRDFKPDNVLIGDDGRVRVLDFGVARAPRGEGDELDREALAGWGDGEAGPVDDRLPLDGSMTPTGHAVGTPRFMAPEQHRGQEADGRADQYAWGVVLYEAITRERPFDATEYRDLRRLVLGGQVRPIPESAAAPRWLERMIRRAMAVDRAARYPSMHDIIAELDQDREALRRAALDSSRDAEAMIAAFPPPAAAAERVQRLRALVEEAWAKRSRGALAPALDLAREVVAEATALDYLPMRAAGLYLMGNLQHRMGDSGSAHAALLAAAHTAARAGDDWQVANAWVFLVLVLGAGLGRTAEAEMIGAVADVALARIGDNPSLRSRLDNYRGASLSVAGRHDEAAAALVRAVALDELTHGAGHWFVVVSLLNLAEVWLDAGLPARARPPLERASAICRPEDGPPTATRTRCLALVGRALAAEGNTPAARTVLERAVAQWEWMPGREAALAEALIDLAACRRAAGDLTAAQGLAGRAAWLLRIAPDRRAAARLDAELAIERPGPGPALEP